MATPDNSVGPFTEPILDESGQPMLVEKVQKDPPTNVPPEMIAPQWGRRTMQQDMEDMQEQRVPPQGKEVPSPSPGNKMVELRMQYPQYADMNDIELADAMHAKHYSDMPKEDFEGKVFGTPLGRIGQTAIHAVTNAIEEGWKDVQTFMQNGDPRAAFRLAATLATGGSFKAEQGAVGVFGGRLSKTADKQALQNSQTLEALGAKESEIVKQTGWFRDASGQWRYEIKDSQMVFKKGIETKFAKDGEVNMKTTLGKIISHPELEKTGYIDYVPVHITIKPGVRAGGSFTGDTYMPGKGSLRVVAKDLDEAKSVLIHEIQHHVSDYENFAAGGRASQGVADYLRTSDEVLARNAQGRAKGGYEKSPLETQDYPNKDQIVRRDRTWSPWRDPDTGRELSDKEADALFQDLNKYVRGKLPPTEMAVQPVGSISEVGMSYFREMVKDGVNPTEIARVMTAYHTPSGVKITPDQVRKMIVDDGGVVTSSSRWTTELIQKLKGLDPVILGHKQPIEDVVKAFMKENPGASFTEGAVTRQMHRMRSLENFEQMKVSEGTVKNLKTEKDPTIARDPNQAEFDFNGKEPSKIAARLQNAKRTTSLMPSEVKAIYSVLDKAQGRTALAAERLGINKQRLDLIIKKYPRQET